MISQLERFFELKFGIHVHQQVRFKILQLHTSKKLPYLCNPPCIERHCFEAVLPKKRLGPLGVKTTSKTLEVKTLIYSQLLG